MKKSMQMIFVAVLLLCAKISFSQIPRTIAWQGILTDAKGNAPADSQYIVTFGFYNTESGGSALWTETDTLVLRQEMASVILGTKNPINLPFDKQYWLGISIAGKETLPRLKLSSSAYAMRADTATYAKTIPPVDNVLHAVRADTASVAKNIDGSGISAGSVNGEKITDSSITGADISSKTEIKIARLLVSGNVGLGIDNPIAKLDIKGDFGNDGAPSEDVSAATIARFMATSSESQGLMSILGSKLLNRGIILSSYQDPGSGMMFATRTSPPEVSMIKIQMVITGDGGIGIGTTEPTSKVDIRGGLPFKSSLDIMRTSGHNDSTSILRLFNDDPKEDKNLVFNVLRNGSVGISTPTPSEKLDVNGNIRCASLIQTSDRRFKTSVSQLDSSLEKISRLNGVSFEWDRVSYPDRDFPEGKQIGLIAQDVEEVIPEVVSTDKEGWKSVAYDRLVAVLIEAVKEQKKRIEILEREVALLKNR